LRKSVLSNCAFADLAGEEAFSQRTKRNEADAEFLERGNHFRFRLSPPKGIFALQRRDRVNGMCTTDGRNACFGKSEVLHFALLNQILHRPGYVFDRNVWIDTVLIEQVDNVGPEAFERGIGDLLDVFWATIESTPTLSTIGVRLEAEFRGDHHLIPKRGQCFAHKFFVAEGTINFSGIEEVDAAFDSGANQRNHFCFFGRRAVAEAHAHAAEAESGDFEIAFAKFAFLHCFLLLKLFAGVPHIGRK
jgi:hypothetical protein